MNILAQKGFSRALARAVEELKEDAYEHGYEHDPTWKEFIWELEDYSKKLTAKFERNLAFGLMVGHTSDIFKNTGNDND